MRGARRGQLERRQSASGVSPSRGGASKASEHGVAACHLRGELETETHGLLFTDWLAKMRPLLTEFAILNYFFRILNESTDFFRTVSWSGQSSARPVAVIT